MTIGDLFWTRDWKNEEGHNVRDIDPRRVMESSLIIQINTPSSTASVVTDINKPVAGNPFLMLEEWMLKKFVPRYGCNEILDCRYVYSDNRQNEGPMNNTGRGGWTIERHFFGVRLHPYQNRIENKRRTQKRGELWYTANANHRKVNEEAEKKSSWWWIPCYTYIYNLCLFSTTKCEILLLDSVRFPTQILCYG